MPGDLPLDPPQDCPATLAELWPLVMLWGRTDVDATNNAESAVPFGDLAQAAIEARFALDRHS